MKSSFMFDNCLNHGSLPSTSNNRSMDSFMGPSSSSTGPRTSCSEGGIINEGGKTYDDFQPDDAVVYEEIVVPQSPNQNNQLHSQNPRRARTLKQNKGSKKRFKEVFPRWMETEHPEVMVPKNNDDNIRKIAKVHPLESHPRDDVEVVKNKHKEESIKGDIELIEEQNSEAPPGMLPGDMDVFKEIADLVTSPEIEHMIHVFLGTDDPGVNSRSSSFFEENHLHKNDPMVTTGSSQLESLVEEKNDSMTDDSIHTSSQCISIVPTPYPDNLVFSGRLLDFLQNTKQNTSQKEIALPKKRATPRKTESKKMAESQQPNMKLETKQNTSQKEIALPNKKGRPRKTESRKMDESQQPVMKLETKQNTSQKEIALPKKRGRPRKTESNIMTESQQPHMKLEVVNDCSTDRPNRKSKKISTLVSEESGFGPSLPGPSSGRRSQGGPPLSIYRSFHETNLDDSDGSDSDNYNKKPRLVRVRESQDEINRILNNTRSRRILNNTRSRRILNNTRSRRILNNTRSRRILNNTRSRRILNNTRSRRILNSTRSRRILNNTRSRRSLNNIRSKRSREKAKMQAEQNVKEAQQLEERNTLLKLLLQPHINVRCIALQQAWGLLDSCESQISQCSECCAESQTCFSFVKRVIKLFLQELYLERDVLLNGSVKQSKN